MRIVERNAYVKFSAKEMFLLVDDIESYPEFIPWCSETEIHQRLENNVTASISLSGKGLQTKFTTSNQMQLYETIDLRLDDGPFSHFEGGWKFIDLGDDGSKIQFNLNFEFKNKVLDLTLGPFFEEICDKLVNIFVDRANFLLASSH